MKSPYPLWRLRWRRRLRSLVWSVALLALLGALWWANRPPLHSGHMLFASDGDSLTLMVDGAPVRVRLIGIDAPERGQMCRDVRGQAWPCGAKARDALIRFAARQAPLACVAIGRDEYGRALSRCKLADGRDLAAQLVSGGWAIATDEDYLLEQETARGAKAGIWQGEFVTPAEWRAANPRSNAAMFPPF